MKNILEQIYYGNELRPFRPDEEYKTLSEESERLWDEAHEKLGFREAERLWEKTMQLASREGFFDFRDGFYLGAGLMLELLQG